MNHEKITRYKIFPYEMRTGELSYLTEPAEERAGMMCYHLDVATLESTLSTQAEEIERLKAEMDEAVEILKSVSRSAVSGIAHENMLGLSNRLRGIFTQCQDFLTRRKGE